MNLPTGNITFLFTDIEGSTRLWESYPEPMRLALAQHDGLLRGCIENSGGQVIKNVGDGFCAVFADPNSAVAAAIAAQQCLITLALTTMDGSLPVKVRMAMHTGVAELRDSDYFGQPLNRVARMLATAHGGQVLLSQITFDLVRDSLRGGASVKSLGEHRLRDLGRSENLFQLLHASLQSEFPPLRSLDNPLLKHNLPQQLSSFVGREEQIAEVKSLLSKTRLLTLTGSGGSGKTRLALQVAADMVDGNGIGAWLVEFAPLTDPNLVPAMAAGIFGLKEEPGRVIQQTLIDHLKTKHLLLLLDNCEHLLDACARLADTILRQCPGVLIMVTSREGLGISGETTYRVPSLSLPDAAQPQTPESLFQYEAVRLFVDRARLVYPAFMITDRNAPALASICQRLDGIPLALELAAARARSMTVEDINNRLDQRFRLLTGGSRTALPRHQTLRSLIDWSYDLLNDAEKKLLCRLSVFAGGWTLEAAEAICSADPIEQWETLDLLTGLVDKSLTIFHEGSGEGRCRLLETVRQYAREKLAESGESEQVRQRHLEFFQVLAEEAERRLMGSEQAEWLARLEREHDNIRAALAWSVGDPTSAVSGLRLAGAVWRFWSMHGYFSEGRERLAKALAAAPKGESVYRAKALNGAGGLAWVQCDYAGADALFEQALTINRALGDLSAIAFTLGNLGLVANSHGNHAAARARFEEAIGIQRELGNRRGYAGALGILGIVAFNQREYAEARALYEEALTINRELGNLHFQAINLSGLGAVDQVEGKYAAARAALDKSLSFRSELGDRSGIAGSLESIAALDAVVGAPHRASLLWGAAERLREVIGAPLPPDGRYQRQQQLVAARAALGDDTAFDAAWIEGRALPMEQAILLALSSEAAGRSISQLEVDRVNSFPSQIN